MQHALENGKANKWKYGVGGMEETIDESNNTNPISIVV